MPRINSSNWNVNDQITAARLQDFNEDLDDIYSLGTDRGRVRTAASATALRIDIAAFNYRIGSSTGQYAGGTDIVVTNTATNYVEIDTSGVIQINTSGWTSDGTRGRLATVTCSGGVVTAISIWKPDLVGGLLGGSPSYTVTAKTAAYTVTSPDSNTVFTTEGAASIIPFTLPTPVAGEKFLFVPTTDWAWITVANTGTQSIVTLSGGSILSLMGAVPNTIIELMAISTTVWMIIRTSGEWLNGKGYVVGGANNNSSTIYTKIDDIIFATDTSAELSAVLAASRFRASGINNDLAGYSIAGYNSGISTTSTIYKLLFSTEATSTPSATATISTQASAAMESSTKGYKAGGYDGAAYRSVIDAFTFSTEAVAALAATLAAILGYMSACASTTKGYYIGGTDGTQKTTIQYVTFSTDARTTSGNTTTAILSDMACAFCGTRAVLMGGNYNAGTAYNKVAVFTYSDDTYTNKAATLTTGRIHVISSGIDGPQGYLAGGLDSGETTQYSSFEKFSYLSETISSVSGSLDTGRGATVGLSQASR